jgi:hypothetical protein
VEAVIVYPETSERRLLWILLGLSLLMVAAVAWWGADQQAERRSSQDKAAVMEQVASRSIEELGSLRTIANRVTDPRLPVADLHGSGDDFAQVRARAVYDLARAELWLRVVALPAATNNEVYALWLGEPGQEQLVGSLLPQIFMRGGTSHFALPEEVREPFRLRLSRQSSEGLAEAPGLGVIVFAAVLGAQPPAEPAD